MNNIKASELKNHETKRHALSRFLVLIAILVVYFFWMTYRFGSKGGLEVTLLTWSFFVFCTPVADAGFLIAFPIRLITGVRMLTSQIYVFLSALLIDVYFFIFHDTIFSKTLILQIFKRIVTNPFPYWSIIALSVVGTFFSIYFGDELVDAVKHKDRTKYQKHKTKHRYVVFVFFFIITFFLYKDLLQNLGLDIAI